METKLAIMVFFLWSMLVCTTHGSKTTYKIRSLFRAMHRTDCTLLKVEMDKTGKPSHLTMKGHCCQNKKHSDFEFIKYASHRGLEAKFQWSHDKRYYLTAQSTGSPLTVEIPSNGVTNKHRFVVKGSTTCSDCVTFQSVETGKFLASTRDGKIIMETNRKLQSTIFQVYDCPQSLNVLCPFVYVPCN